jgi:hypothetical protein
MTDLEKLRARYKATKKARARGFIGRGKGTLVIKAKADARARRYIERWLEGETYREIGASEGIAYQTVASVITAYRKRHPDVAIPETNRHIEWTDADVATLRKLRSQGKTAEFIGQQIGRTPNAIYGKIDRMRKAGEI